MELHMSYSKKNTHCNRNVRELRLFGENYGKSD